MEAWQCFEKQQAQLNNAEHDVVAQPSISAVSHSSEVLLTLQNQNILPFDHRVAFLCKGSRGIKMERCIEDLLAFHQSRVSS